jgi:hypothetical protein
LSPNKYLKLYEGYRRDIVLYECNDFTIEYNSNDAFCVATKEGSSLGAISYMADLILDNSKYLKGELVPVSKGFIVVKDKNNNCFSVSTNDPRYLSGELVPIAKGLVTVKDKDSKIKI